MGDVCFIFVLGRGGVCLGFSMAKSRRLSTDIITCLGLMVVFAVAQLCCFVFERRGLAGDVAVLFLAMASA